MADRSGFISLANELLLSIIELLDSSSIISLNATNRRLHHLTQEHVYSSFRGYEYSRFLRTITASPHLSTHVTSATCLVNPSKYIFQGIAEDDRVKIQDIFMKKPLADEESQSDLLSNYNIYGDSIQHHWFLDFFLLFLPNLTHLEVRDAWQWNDHQYWFTHLSANGSYLSHLRSITIHGPCRIRNILHLFTLSSLQELELWEVVETRQAAGATWEWESTTGMNTEGQSVESKLAIQESNVEVLRLKGSYIKPEDLALVLASCRALKAFEYEHIANDLAVPRDVDPDFEHLATLLNKHAPTLKQLSIFHTEAEHTMGIFPLISSDAWSDTHNPTFPHLTKFSLTLVFAPGTYTDADDAFTDAGKRDMSESVDRFLLQLPLCLEELRVRVKWTWTNRQREMGSWWIKCLVEQGGWVNRKVRVVRVGCDMRDGDVVAGERVSRQVIVEQSRVTEELFRDVGVEFVWDRGQWMGASGS